MKTMAEWTKQAGQDRKFIYYGELRYENGVIWRSRPYETIGPAKAYVTRTKKRNPNADAKAAEYELVPTGRVF